MKIVDGISKFCEETRRLFLADASPPTATTCQPDQDPKADNNKTKMYMVSKVEGSEVSVQFLGNKPKNAPDFIHCSPPCQGFSGIGDAPKTPPRTVSSEAFSVQTRIIECNKNDWTRQLSKLIGENFSGADASFSHGFPKAEKVDHVFVSPPCKGYSSVNLSEEEKEGPTRPTLNETLGPEAHFKKADHAFVSPPCQGYSSLNLSEEEKAAPTRPTLNETLGPEAHCMKVDHLHVSPPCKGYSSLNLSEEEKEVPARPTLNEIDHIHASPPCKGCSSLNLSEEEKEAPTHPTLNEIDHIHASPPCQGYSLANHSHREKKKGLLTPEFYGLIKVFRPAAVTVEAAGIQVHSHSEKKKDLLAPEFFDLIKLFRPATVTIEAAGTQVQATFPNQDFSLKACNDKPEAYMGVPLV